MPSVSTLATSPYHPIAPSHSLSIPPTPAVTAVTSSSSSAAYVARLVSTAGAGAGARVSAGSGSGAGAGAGAGIEVDSPADGTPWGWSSAIDYVPPSPMPLAPAWISASPNLPAPPLSAFLPRHQWDLSAMGSGSADVTQGSPGNESDYSEFSQTGRHSHATTHSLPPALPSPAGPTPRVLLTFASPTRSPAVAHNVTSPSALSLSPAPCNDE